MTEPTSLAPPIQSHSAHIAYLDSIRGLAALTVVSEHFVIAYGLPCEQLLCQQLLDYSPLHIWWDGIAAVSMFFVLSGLVLSLKYYRINADQALLQLSLSGFIMTRICRIWLPYCVILLISAFLYLSHIKQPIQPSLLAPSDWITQMWRGHPLTLMDMIREGFLLHLPHLVVLLPQSWTLTIELVLSLLLPIGLLLAQRNSRWLLFFGGFAVTFLDISILLLHFILGLLLAKYQITVTQHLKTTPRLRWLFLIMGLLLYTAADTLFKLLNDNGLWFCSGLGATMILMFVLGSEPTQVFLSKRLLRLIGKVSYSIYLLHMAVLICLTPYLLKTLEFFTANHFLLWLGGWLLTIAISVLLSIPAYHWLEVPCMALGRNLNQKLQIKRGQLAQATLNH